MNLKFILSQILCLIILITACSKEDSDSDRNVTFDENGVKIISNPENGKWQSSDTGEIQFELIDQFSFEDAKENIISGMSFLNQGPERHLYFFDRQQNKLISTNDSGEIRWSVGQPGRGPGDFENVSSVKVINDKVIVSNIQGTRLDIFDLKGEFKRSIQLKDDIIFAKIVGESPSGELVISSMLRGKLGVNVYMVNIDPELTDSNITFQISQGPELDVKVGVGLDAGLNLRGEKIYSGNTSSYEIGVYSMTGELLQKITRDFDKMVRPGIITTGNFSAIRTFGELSKPFFLNDGSFFTISLWPKNIEDPDQYLDDVQNNTAHDIIRANSLDYFSKDGELLYSIEHDGFYPEIGNLQFISENNILYTLKGLSIYKYKITIKSR
jgi:hypothetical protein